MSREVPIPLVLWISTATLVHAAGGGGAIEAARTLSDRASVRSMVTELREQLSPDQGTIEVLTDSAQITPRSETNPAENPSATPVDPAKEPPKPDAKKEPPKKPPPRPIVVKKVEPPPKPPEPPKIKPPEPPKVAKKPPPPPLLPLKEPPKVETPKPPPPPPPEVAKKEDEPKKAVPPPPPPPPDRRTAVVQDVQKDQADNPTARRIADQANTTKEETVARVRAYDGTPTAKLEGGRTGSDPEKGNSDENKTGHNEDKAGNKDHAPGEKAAAVATIHSNPAPPAPPSPGGASRSGPPLSVPGNTGGGGRQVSLSPPGAQPPSPATPGGSGPAAPETHSSASGNWSLDPANPGGDGSSRVAGVKREAVYQSPVKVQSMGFGAPGLPGGTNINLTFAGLEGAVGQDKFKQERAADGEARRAKHRGASGAKDKLDWRAAVENYEPSVKVGNQTSLNAAASAFGSYLNTIHNRIHPIFADEFLQSLSKLPPGHTLNDNLVTFVEIVVGKDDGKIVRTGITKASGSTMFDLIAVNAARRAGPYGKPPDAIVSPDGNVYIHWEFHRDPYDACSSRNARPYMLKAPEAKTDPSAQPAPKPVPPPKPVDQRTEPPRTESPVPLPVQRF